MDIAQIHACFLKCTSVSIDTRKIENNSFFVALKGTSFDANTFAKEALEKGASFVLIDNGEFYLSEQTILVTDCLTTLQQLASFHRKYLNLTIIALTGSNGKTTTKELFQIVLSRKYKTKATLGNLNNHIGVPLTLLSFTKETEIGIVEMGANHQKEIAFLCEIAQPDFGYITNFGKAHLEGFGGVEGVIKGKSEMYDYLSATDKKVFVNLDDSIQYTKTMKMNQITFSNSTPDGFIYIDKIEANPFVKINYQNVEIQSNLIGLYNATNIMAAITVGRYFNVDNEEIKQALESYQPDNNRSQIIYQNSNEIILDAYNANPSSMDVALQNFIQLGKASKIAVLGDMFELGNESHLEHRSIVKKLRLEANFNCYLIGKEFYLAKEHKSNLHFFQTFDEFSAYLKDNPIQNSIILIKGSRGMALERILKYI